MIETGFVGEPADPRDAVEAALIGGRAPTAPTAGGDLEIRRPRPHDPAEQPS